MLNPGILNSGGDYTGLAWDPAVVNRWWAHGWNAQSPTQQRVTKVVHFETGCGMDFNGDGASNAADASLFFSALQAGEPEAELVLDGQIDANDAAALPEALIPK